MLAAARVVSGTPAPPLPPTLLLTQRVEELEGNARGVATGIELI